MPKGVGVQVPPRAPSENLKKLSFARMRVFISKMKGSLFISIFSLYESVVLLVREIFQVYHRL